MTTCSALARSLGEPLPGTAPRARVWLAVEQPGPWGRKALVDSHLPAQLLAALAAAGSVPQATVTVIRRPGRHADVHDPARPRRVILASVAAGRRWLRQTTCTSEDDLLALDLPTAARAAVDGRPPAWGETAAGPVVLVCTNGRRDRCCAEQGRPVALALVGRLGDTVWETSHLGGHRFAPTTLVLPTGAVFGGLDAGRLAETVTAVSRGTLPLRGLRGLTALDPAQQVADHAARAHRGWDEVDGTDVGPAQPSDGDGWSVRVTGPDGSVLVTVRPAGRAPRPESCGADAVRRVDLTAAVEPGPRG